MSGRGEGEGEVEGAEEARWGRRVWLGSGYAPHRTRGERGAEEVGKAVNGSLHGVGGQAGRVHARRTAALRHSGMASRCPLTPRG